MNYLQVRWPTARIIKNHALAPTPGISNTETFQFKHTFNDV